MPEEGGYREYDGEKADNQKEIYEKALDLSRDAYTENVIYPWN